MIDQLNKKHQNLQLRGMLSRTTTLKVENGTDVVVERGCGEWLEDTVGVIRIRMQTPYFDAQLTLCDREMGWDLLSQIIDSGAAEDEDDPNAQAKALAGIVLSRFSVKETLLMTHEAHYMGLKEGKNAIRRDIKRLLHI